MNGPDQGGASDQAGDPWATAIVRALADLGGSAHQDAILNRIKSDRNVQALDAAEWNAFVASLARQERQAAPLFARAGDLFGRRWTLTERGAAIAAAAKV